MVSVPEPDVALADTPPQPLVNHEQRGTDEERRDIWEEHAWPLPEDPAERTFAQLDIKRTYNDHVHNPFYHLAMDWGQLRDFYGLRDWPIRKVILNRERETVWEDSLFEVLTELSDKYKCLFPLLVNAHHHTPPPLRTQHFSERMLQLIDEHLQLYDYDFNPPVESDVSDSSDQDTYLDT